MNNKQKRVLRASRTRADLKFSASDLVKRTQDQIMANIIATFKLGKQIRREWYLTDSQREAVAEAGAMDIEAVIERSKE